MIARVRERVEGELAAGRVRPAPARGARRAPRAALGRRAARSRSRAWRPSRDIPRRRLTETRARGARGRAAACARGRRQRRRRSTRSPTRVAGLLTRGGAFSLAPVINATGVVLHTNLGRALLSAAARASGSRARPRPTPTSRWTSRGRSAARATRTSRACSAALTGAEAALVVNNCAAAVLLALETLARGKEVVVSRGELIEIGGEFRIPDIMRRAGAVLREVGTTNRTHLRTTPRAIGPRPALLLKVHASNYRVVGFTAAVAAPSSRAGARARRAGDGGPGLGLPRRPPRYGFPHEPTVPEVVAAGVDLVSFSGDKLLGGPQAGIVVGAAS